MIGDILIHPQTLISVGILSFTLSLFSVLPAWQRARALKRQGNESAPVLNLSNNDFKAAEKLYVTDLKNLLRSGYAKFKYGVYQLWSVDGYLAIVSPDFVDEMKNMPTDVLDFHGAAQKRMIGQYEWVNLGSNLLAKTVLNDLTKQMGSLMPQLTDEIRYALKTEMPDCKEWTPVTVYPTIARIVAIMSGRAFVGSELNHNEEWLEATIEFTMQVFKGGWKLKQWSYFLRPLAARFFIPEIHNVWKYQAKARRILVPIMKERLRAQREQGAAYQKPNDMIQWLMDNGATDPSKPSLEKLAELQLVVSFAAIHTTTLTCTHVIFDLAARPEYIAPLREEIEAAKQQYNGLSSKQALSQLSRLDSFMKESQRLNPAGLLTFSRLVQKPVTLSNGVKLNPGTHLLVPAGLISLDDDIWESAMEFRGFRFHDLRAARREDAFKYQFATTSPRAMHFGHGKQSCPGRFFASHEIKAILSMVLQEFDIKLVDEKAGRPKNREFGAQIAPDEGAQIAFKVRSS